MTTCYRFLHSSIVLRSFSFRSVSLQAVLLPRTSATYRARFAPVLSSFRSRHLLASFSYRSRLASRLALRLPLRPFSLPSHISSFSLRSRFNLASSSRSRFDCRFALPSVSLRGSLRVRFDLAWCSLRARVVLASFSLRCPSFV